MFLFDYSVLMGKICLFTPVSENIRLHYINTLVSLVLNTVSVSDYGLLCFIDSVHLL